MTRCDLSVNIVPVVGTIAGKGHHGTIYPIEQGADLGAIVGIPARQDRGDDLAGVSVCDEVEHLPAPAPLATMLLFQPSAGTTQPKASAVHQQVHRLAARLRSRHLQRLGPTAQGRMVRHREVEAEQLQNGADQALVWRSARRNTARSVRAVAIARFEYFAWHRQVDPSLAGRERSGRRPE